MVEGKVTTYVSSATDGDRSDITIWTDKGLNDDVIKIQKQEEEIIIVLLDKNYV